MKTWNEIKDGYVLTPLIPGPQLGKKIAELSLGVMQFYSGLIGELVICPVMVGALPFVSDLIRNIRLPFKVEPVRVSTYEGGEKPVKRPTTKDDLQFAHGKHILIVDDILDEGHTLAYLTAELRKAGASSVEVMVLIRKNGTQKAFLDDPRWVGFNIPPTFVVGYGLDFHGYHRNLPFVGMLQEKKVKPKIDIALN